MHINQSRTVAGKSSVEGFYVCAGGLYVRAVGLDIIIWKKIPLMYGVSYFNLGGLGALFEGTSPPKFPRGDWLCQCKEQPSHPALQICGQTHGLFVCMSSDIRAERLRITSRFAPDFSHSSLTPYCRTMLHLLIGSVVWFGGLNKEFNSNLCDTIKRLALTNIVCEVNSKINWILYALLKGIVSFSRSINKSPNISPNDQHLFDVAVKSTTDRFALTI